MKGIVVTTDGKITVTKFSDFPETLSGDIEGVIGGFYEIVRPRNLKRGHTMLVNADGFYLNLEPNPLAGSVYGATIVGNVIFLKEGFLDGDIDFVPFSDEELQELEGYLIHLNQYIHYDTKTK